LFADPHQHLAVFVDGELFDLNEFFLERLQMVVGERKFNPERAVGYTSLPLEKSGGLLNDVGKPHNGRLTAFLCGADDVQGTIAGVA
jgi:hypothetical protein